ncbi:MAG: regulatory protein GemA [Lysobacteraceae bacterium]|nr:MAG: regulatory protein GemA [Xanthomonadaceae bacterium]
MGKPKDRAVARRRALLAAIHAEAKQREKFGLDEDAYRDLVERVSGEHGTPVRSAGDCTPRQLEAVLDELRRLGGAPACGAQTGQQWPGRPAGELSPLLSKIEALLADAGRPWAYATAVARRICKVDRLEWCSDEQLGKVVAALQINADRHGRSRRRPGGRRRG